MPKLIWTCWLQGRANAPALVQSCLQSWEGQNPGWEFRCLDATSIRRYIDLDEHIDLTTQEITAASLSDIIRILLLHEYGGVWADATLFCNRPLDDWLPAALTSGFFAFSNPAPDRLLSSWFLSADPGHLIAESWAAATVNYWRGRKHTDDYFWFHHLFGSLAQSDPAFRRAWNAVPRIAADGPHALLNQAEPDPQTPVFKLSHRMETPAPGSPIDTLLAQFPPQFPSHPLAPPPAAISQAAATSFIGLKTKTENLGDHIQILAAERLLSRAGVTVTTRIDRDDDIASAAEMAALAPGTGILLNGWFKTNPTEWPPHENLAPLYLGFHIRLFQAPSLISPAALAHYQTHGPIGCRDDYTLSLLRGHGVDAYLSHCLSLVLPRRLPAPTQTEIFAVSRDEALLSIIPPSLGPVSFINHYSGSADFAANMAQAAALLARYRDRAKLIITTLLHCALPAIAMGIPVIVFYPRNPEPQRQSDRERFSTLARMIEIHEFGDGPAEWTGQTIDVSHIKLTLIETFFDLARRWTLPTATTLEPIAPASALPLPTPEQLARFMVTAPSS